MRPILDSDGENRAVRAFLAPYGCGNPTAAGMAKHLRWSGFDIVPDWVSEAPGHLTKGAQLWLRMLFAAEQSPAQAGKGE